MCKCPCDAISDVFRADSIYVVLNDVWQWECMKSFLIWTSSTSLTSRDFSQVKAVSAALLSMNSCTDEKKWSHRKKNWMT